jgi:hypothetical protein
VGVLEYYGDASYGAPQSWCERTGNVTYLVEKPKHISPHISIPLTLWMRCGNFGVLKQGVGTKKTTSHRLPLYFRQCKLFGHFIYRDYKLSMLPKESNYLTLVY